MKKIDCKTSFALVIVLLLTLFSIRAKASTFQANSGRPSSRLDAVLRSGDVEKAKPLVLDDVGAADQLFLSYLQQSIDPTQTEAAQQVLLGRAKRLAEVFFKLFDLDFELGVIAWWEKASPAQKQELFPVLREHFDIYREERTADDAAFPRYGHDYRLVAAYRALAEKYRAISFGKGEVQARLGVCNYDPDEAWKTWQLANSLQDDVAEAWAIYHFGIWEAEDDEPEVVGRRAVEAAARLHLPRLSQEAFARLAWRALNSGDYDGAIDSFRHGLEAARTVPVAQTMVNRSGRRFYPSEASFCLALWRAYKLMDKPEAQAMFDKGCAMSRQYGGKIGELAYLIDATQQLIQQGIFADVAFQAEALARKMGDPGWLARFLITKSDGLQATQESKKGIQAANEAADLFKKIGSRGHFADCLYRRAIFRTQTDEFGKAEADFEQAIKIYRELDLLDKAAEAGLDAGYYLRSQPVTARKFLDEALSDAEKAGRSARINMVLYGRGQFMLRDSPETSVQDFLSALSFAEKSSEESGVSGRYLDEMNNISQALRRLGKISQAVEIQKQRAEKARLKSLFSTEADAYYWLQDIYSRDLGETALAAEYANKFQALTTRPGLKLGVSDYNRIAASFNNIGQPARALEAWAEGLKRAKEIPGSESDQRALRANTAGAYLQLGDYDAALEELEEEKALIERTPGIYKPPVELHEAQLCNKTALVRALAGDWQKAVDDSLEAIRLESKTAPGTELVGYYSYFTPGDALAQAGRFDKALEFYSFRKRRAQEIHSVHGERAALVGAGLVWLRAGNIEKARESLQAAVEIDSRPPGPQTGALADSLLSLARVEVRAGDLKRAEELLLEARKTANPYDLNQIWQIERETAGVFARTARPELAWDHFELALNSLERSRERLRPEEFSMRFGIDRLRVYDEYISHLAARAMETGSETDAGKALQALERRRAQALWDMMATGWARLPPDAVPEQLRRMRETEERLTAKQNLLRDQFNLSPEKRNAALIKTLDADLEQARAAHTRLLSSLAQGRFRLSSPAGIPGDLTSRIRKELGPDRALVDYYVADQATYAFVVTSSSLNLQQTPVGREELRKKVQSLLNPFYRLGKGELDLARIEFDLKAAHELYKQLFASLEPKIGRARKVLVVPDDVLYYLPIEILVDHVPDKLKPEKTLFGEYRDIGFLVKRFSLSYLTAASRLLPTEESPPPRGKDFLLLAMANPSAKPESLTSGSEDPLTRQLGPGASSRAFAPLPTATAEIEKISRNFPGRAVALVSGEKATETCYKELAAKYEILHLATHAMATDRQPLYSTLILAPDAPTHEDGFLQAYEVLRYPLRARLVVLSACETAMGPLGRGEGLVGLVSAFQQAGARSVLATQWTIGETTADLMASFYKAMTAGRPLTEALREAKLETMKKHLRVGDTDVSQAHPLFWAPFVLIGGTD
jgi:CHAT domain-containing protein